MARPFATPRRPSLSVDWTPRHRAYDDARRLRIDTHRTRPALARQAGLPDSRVPALLSFSHGAPPAITGEHCRVPFATHGCQVRGSQPSRAIHSRPRRGQHHSPRAHRTFRPRSMQRPTKPHGSGTLGVVFAHFFKPGVLWVQLILVGSTIPIAIFANAFRVALTGFLAHHWGEDAAGGVVHDLQGVFTFGMAFFILLSEGRLIDFLLGIARNSDDPGGDGGGESGNQIASSTPSLPDSDEAPTS